VIKVFSLIVSSGNADTVASEKLAINNVNGSNSQERQRLFVHDFHPENDVSIP